MTYWCIHRTLVDLTIHKSETKPDLPPELYAESYDEAIAKLQVHITGIQAELRASLERIKDCKLSIQTRSLTLVDDDVLS